MRNALLIHNPTKAPGPDRVPSWLLREYASILMNLIEVVLNSSFCEQKLPQRWKMADVVPIPKEQPSLEINKHLCAVSLTPSLS